MEELKILCPHPLPTPRSLTHGGADAVALGVDEPADLGEVAVPLCDVLDGRGLHEQSVVGRECPLDALLVVLHQSRGLAAHEGPHLLKGGDLGFLGGEGWEYVNHSNGAPPPMFHSLWPLSVAPASQLWVNSVGQGSTTIAQV